MASHVDVGPDDIALVFVGRQRRRFFTEVFMRLYDGAHGGTEMTRKVFPERDERRRASAGYGGVFFRLDGRQWAAAACFSLSPSCVLEFVSVFAPAFVTAHAVVEKQQQQKESLSREKIDGIMCCVNLLSAGAAGAMRTSFPRGIFLAGIFICF